LWCFCGEFVVDVAITWCFGAGFLGAESTPLFSGIFFRVIP